MKALMLIYDTYAEFEVMLVGLFLQQKGVVHMVADRDDKEFVTGAGQFQTKPHVKLSDINVADYDILIVPGGQYEEIYRNEQLLDLVRAFHREDKWIAAICGGPALLAAAGVLGNIRYTNSLNPELPGCADIFQWENRLEQDVVIDGKFITSPGGGYVEFAIAIHESLGLFDSEQEKLDSLHFFRNIKQPV